MKNVHGFWRYFGLHLSDSRRRVTGLVAASIACLFLATASDAHVRLDSMLGGATFAGGETIDLYWDAYLYHGPGTVDVEFSEDGGISYTPIASDIPIPSREETVGVTMWTVPSIDSALCRVKVTYTVDGGGTYVDVSGEFTIGEPVGGGGGEGGDGEPGEFAVTIGASKDNTLYEDVAGALSNGVGEYLFAGKTGPNGGDSIRRGLIAFDISAAVPSGAVITRVSLSLNASKVASASPQQIALIPMAADWGEGTSDAPLQEGAGAPATDNDATWIHRFSPSSLWATPGGDFASGTSATVSVSSAGSHTFVSTAAMIADVQAWLNTPASNWGWLIAGVESSSSTAVRFDSRENGVASNQPALTIDYNLAGELITANTGTGFLESGVRLELYAPPGTSHQWYRNSVPMVDDPEAPFRISGTQTDTLILDPVLVEDSGAYSCIYEPAKGGTKVPVETAPFLLEVFPEGALPVTGLAGIAALLGTVCVVGIRRTRR